MATTLQDTAPVSGSEIASLPREERRSVQRTKDFFLEHFNAGLSARRKHAISWIMVQSYLQGIHYFRIDGTGRYEPLPPEDGEIRAVAPVIVPWYEQVLGFLNANSLGVTTVAASNGSDALYRAARAQDALNGWIDETSMELVFDRALQYLLTEGTVGFHRYVDTFRQEAFVKALAGSEMFPIPFDARDPSETHGLIHSSVASKQWLELQDEVFERQNGRPPEKRMSDKASSMPSGMHLNTPLLSVGHPGGRFDGALVHTIWMKRTEQTPFGEYMFLVGDEAFRHAVTQQDLQIIMPDGKIPVEISYYLKNPQDFWGIGLCEKLLPAQASKNRNLTRAEQNAHHNRSMTFYDTSAIEQNQIQNTDETLIPMSVQDFAATPTQKPIIHVPAQSVGQDTAALINLQDTLGSQAAGFRSGVIFGQAEGRVDSGAATQTLSQNAFAPLNSTIKRTSIALLNTYKGVLDLFRFAWPQNKTVRLVGPSNIGREVQIQASDLPWSHQVNIIPRPLFAQGTRGLLNILFQLRQIPGPDGQTGTEISSREFRRTLQDMSLLPSGMDLGSKSEARIQTRINLLIGDGQRPSIQPSDPAGPPGGDRLVMEDHQLSVEMLKEAILDSSWETYSPDVQRSLLIQLEFHNNHLAGALGAPDQFDDDNEKLLSLQAKQHLDAAAADLSTTEGEFSPESLQQILAAGV